MSSTQNVPSPRAPRARNHPPKSADPAMPTQDGNKSQRRKRSQRAPNGITGDASTPSSGANPTEAQEPPHLDGTVASSSMPIPSGSRNSKRHSHHQQTTERVFSPATGAPSMKEIESGRSTNTASPAKNQGAYAGPTFHASPAPSALPMPKFLSKSVPPKTRAGPPTPPLDEGSDASASPTPSPSRAPTSVPRYQDSALDMLFKADKAERARKVSGSPVAAMPLSPGVVRNQRPPNTRNDSNGSQHVPFPIELEGDSRPEFARPQTVSPIPHRSVTAPSRILQAQDQQPAPPRDDPNVMADLLNRLSMSQKKTASPLQSQTAAFPPPYHGPQDHTSPCRGTPSPSHNATAPSTPEPLPQHAPDFHYGNRNLSPLFKQAKVDTSKRNSGLRTEVTADSPTVVQSGFPTQAAATFGTTAPSSAMIGHVPSGPVSPRRGSVPHVPPSYPQPPTQPYRGMHSPHRGGGGSGSSRRSYHGHPELPSHGIVHKVTEHHGTGGTPATSQRPSSSFSFVPSSVRAKPQAATTPKKAAPEERPVPTNATLEHDLKRMLNLTSE